MIEILPDYPDNILAIPAMWEDATTGLEHFTDFEKIAFGSDVDWIKI